MLMAINRKGRHLRGPNSTNPGVKWRRKALQWMEKPRRYLTLLHHPLSILYNVCTGLNFNFLALPNGRNCLQQ